jgi:hypothetical protein
MCKVGQRSSSRSKGKLFNLLFTIATLWLTQHSWQVSPAEIETILKQHNQIADAAVAGVYRSDGVTEVPRAYVVRNTGSGAPRLTAEAVYHFARPRLASYKALDGGVVFVDHIPRTASGKVQRFKLKALTPELSIVENMVAAHCQALTNPETLSKIEIAAGGTSIPEKEGIDEYTGIYGCIGVVE